MALPTRTPVETAMARPQYALGTMLSYLEVKVKGVQGARRIMGATHQHPCGDGDGTPAVGVGHNVAVADREKRDGDHPHRVEQVLVPLVMETVQGKRRYMD